MNFSDLHERGMCRCDVSFRFAIAVLNMEPVLRYSVKAPRNAAAASFLDRPPARSMRFRFPPIPATSNE